jgi:isoleucyl-tRNA synthetase
MEILPMAHDASQPASAEHPQQQHKEPAKEASGSTYRDTLNLPSTTFPMKAGAAKREPEIQAFWEENQVYERVQASKNKQHKYVLHDGPPYLSANTIHIGTALNKILKDIVTRYKTQRGYYSPYVPGYDGHGLPIENAVVKSIKGGRQSITEVELRKRCREFAMANLKGQEENFKRLGVWGHWKKPYVTIEGAFEAKQIELFGKMSQKGYVYKGLKPVYWCASCETALADAEVEYADHTSTSLYLSFPLLSASPYQQVAWTDEQKALLKGSAFAVWTTTPWTLPANVALAVNADFTYSLIQTEAFGKLLVGKELLESFSAAVSLPGYTLLGDFIGTMLEGAMAQHPFLDRTSPVLCGTHVTLEAGTGIVHTAAGHGLEDYDVVQRYNREHPFFREQPLPVLSPLDNRGIFTQEATERLAGQHYEKANPMVVEWLQETGRLVFSNTFSHSYPHCWRCHKPVIYRATEQWFINVDSIREQALEAIRGVTWIPAQGENRIGKMVENRSDWCISRQRVWGVPIPAFYCTQCDTAKLDETTTQIVADLFRKETSDAWWAYSAEEILGNSVPCNSCSNTSYRKEMDIMDVWFDSGVTHTTVVEERSEELGTLPVELYLEGSDQHRGWFQSSLLTSVMVHDGKAPYKAVLTHGFVLDQDGRKMSKSLGNVVDPQSIMKDYGADILRLWVASVDYSHDVRIGKTVISQLAEIYKKIRNTIRFLLGNLFDFYPATDAITDITQFSRLDRYILHRLQELTSGLSEAFDAHEFHRFYHLLQQFCVTDLSSLYFDVNKDVLYCLGKSDPTRLAVQTVLFEVLKTMIPLLIPVMPHMAEDIWLHTRQTLRDGFGSKQQESVLFLPWPEIKPEYQLSEQALQEFRGLLHLKETVNLGLEGIRAAGKIGSALEAAVSVTVKQPDFQFLEGVSGAELATFIQTSTVSVESTLAPTPCTSDRFNDVLHTEGYTITLQPALGLKCERCWRYDAFVGSKAEHTTLCQRCYQQISGLSSSVLST